MDAILHSQPLPGHPRSADWLAILQTGLELWQDYRREGQLPPIVPLDAVPGEIIATNPEMGLTASLVEPP
jgi:hypothetical protein